MFLSYLWGMETSCRIFSSWYRNKVLILPMRNGNKLFTIVPELIINGSYPTYEEWKPSSKNTANSSSVAPFLSYLWGMETRLVQWIWNDYYKRFLSYLWGMETTENILLECQNNHYVLILPMRNGNKGLRDICTLIVTGSYPTYEEWKLCFVNEKIIFLDFLVLILPMRNGNILSAVTAPAAIFAEFLSYLWGMETSIFLFVFYLFHSLVLILPMRNGNKYKHL